MNFLSLVPFWWRLGILAALVTAGVTGCVLRDKSIHNAGRQEAIDEIREVAREKTNAATKAMELRRECTAAGRVWNQSRGQCGGLVSE